MCDKAVRRQVSRNTGDESEGQPARRWEVYGWESVGS